MKALVCKEYGSVEKLVLEDNYPLPELGDNDVLIDVKAAGINFPDTLIIEGKYQIKPELPFIPGAECAGVITAVGAKVGRLKEGDKVISFNAFGAFCQQLVSPETSVYLMPEGVDFEVAAGISMTYFTSYHALKQRAKLQEGETVLVLGAGGGVGITAVELAKQMGATVIAAASTQEKLNLAQQMGADHLINYNEESLKERIKEITQGRGVDVIYDPVGGDYSEIALRSMAWKGRFLVIGFANGEIPKIPLNLVLLKGFEIVGVFYGAFTMREPELQAENMSELWELFAQKRLNPIVNDIYPLSEYVDAYHCLTGRKARGKVILKM